MKYTNSSNSLLTSTKFSLFYTQHMDLKLSKVTLNNSNNLWILRTTLHLLYRQNLMLKVLIKTNVPTSCLRPKQGNNLILRECVKVGLTLRLGLLNVRLYSNFTGLNL